MKKHRRIAVIGGGIAGLATAALAAKQGFEVTVYEKNEQLGGRARVLKKAGFSFDMGPSWYLMPEVVEGYWRWFGREVADDIQLVKLDPRYRVIFDSRGQVDIPGNRDANERWVEKLEQGAGKEMQRYLKRKRILYELVRDELITADTSRVDFWLSVRRWQAMRKLITDWGLWGSWWQETGKYFKSDRLRKVLTFPAVFLGGSPFNTPGVYSILTWADFGEGVWYPIGGMGRLVVGLGELARSQGAKIYTKSEVEEIKVMDGKAVGVKVEGGWQEADAVVATGDMHWTETRLLPREYQSFPESYWQRKVLGIGALLGYWGLKKRIPGVIHHTLFFSRNWQKNFDQIFKRKELPDDPSLYISVRSATDRGIVPAGGEEVVCLVPVPTGLKIGRDEWKKYLERVKAKVESILGGRWKENLAVDEMFTPDDFASDYRAYQGTALGLAHTLGQSVFLRPGNTSRKVKNLFFAGQYNQPGVGVPMAIISAQITAKLLTRM